MMNRIVRRRIATLTAAFLFAFYVSWNAWWLSLGRIPPAILVAATGFPSPTTGGTRSFFALANGDITLSLYHNPATIPIVTLLCVTFMFVIKNGTAPQWVKRSWIQLLSFAFVAKIATSLLL